MIRSFKDLIGWQKGHELVLSVYKVTSDFSDQEKYALVNQIRRAVVSITSNIDEGFGRNTSKDKSHFYAIAKGSVMELQSQMLIAKDLKYMGDKDLKEIEIKCIEVSRIISGLRKSAVDH